MSQKATANLVLLLAVSASVACHSSVVLKRGEASTRPCGSDALIDNAEDGNDKLLNEEGRGGHWYTYLDSSGSTIEPSPAKQAGAFTMAAGGGGGSAMAAHMSGKLTRGGAIFAGMGFNFTEPKRPYDASQYGGVAFLAKKGRGSVAKVHVKLPDVNTDPAGRVCKDCSNDFGASIVLTEEWTRYEVPFSLAQQEKGWGNPQPESIAPDRIYGVKWQVSLPDASYDIWVDDVAFVGCD